MARNGQVDYDQAASKYAAHRRIHGGVFRELATRGKPGPGARLLEVGCGTGNYASTLSERFPSTVYGLDPSAGMLVHARAGREAILWLAGRAEQIPFASNAVDLVFSVDVIHHVTDKATYYCEVARVLRPGGQVCTVTDTAETIRQREILSGYFPETVEVELARYPRIAHLEAWMAAAGLEGFSVVTVQAPYAITNAHPFRDRSYSSLHLIAPAAWQAGLERLERSLARGPVRGMARYACVWGEKP